MAPRTDRATLAAEVRAALEGCCPGSHTHLRGSLAAGTADAYSDIDIAWVVPDTQFSASLSLAVSTLRRVQPVESVRTDPDFQRSDRRRLLFVRFAEVSLFWRLDLDVHTESVADNPYYDTGNPSARAREGDWSRPASALANAIGAVKAAARQRHDEARGMLDRGFARIGEEDRATGAWAYDVARLAHAIAQRDSSLADLAAGVTTLASQHIPGAEAGW